MKAGFAKAHPEVVKALNRLAGQITESQMQEMNYQVQVKHAKHAMWPMITWLNRN